MKALASVAAGVIILTVAAGTEQQPPAGPKVYISIDMEGVGGVTAQDDVMPGDTDYEAFRRRLTAEVNAAVQGAISAGAREVLVEEHHGARGFRNVIVADLHPRAQLIRGWPRPRGGVTGLDRSFQAALFIGYHAREGTSGAVLAHTFLSNAVDDFRINDRSVGEGEFNALVAGAYGVPVVLVSGDQVVGAQMREFLGDVETVAVKQALGMYSAVVSPPAVTAERITEATERALRQLDRFRPTSIAPPYRAEFRYKSAWVDRLDRISARHPEIDRVGARALGRTCASIDELIDFYMAALDIEMGSPSKLGEKPPGSQDVLR